VVTDEALLDTMATVASPARRIGTNHSRKRRGTTVPTGVAKARRMHPGRVMKPKSSASIRDWRTAAEPQGLERDVLRIKTKLES
jgi:hypothetical protein